MSLNPIFPQIAQALSARHAADTAQWYVEDVLVVQVFSDKLQLLSQPVVSSHAIGGLALTSGLVARHVVSLLPSVDPVLVNLWISCIPRNLMLLKLFKDHPNLLQQVAPTIAASGNADLTHLNQSSKALSTSK